MMTVSEAMRKRRTIRGFKPEPVAEDVLQKILQTAQLAPSNCNTQPWFFTVVSGEARDKLEKALMAELIAGKTPTPAFTPGDAGLDGVYRDRQYSCAADYYQTMGIERQDKAARNKLMAKNWQFFDAPHVGFLTMPLSMGAVNAIDVGIYLQSLMLLMVEHGLASCPQGALAFYPDPICDIAGIPEGHGILCGLSFGYADEEAKINEVHMGRADLPHSVKFVS
ncbi:nitroreductase [Paraglaciecola sp. 20A4]|uniref:nitroreductase n=1 Tax=Paraglaciecola sp. 20A4 TaxID=2687288 RepID=UPI0014097133|nr:nitroreductase [Paraglaciecola sp. 20A4]